MCKHVAAALYGVGARLDEKPELLFVLRGVDENELLAGRRRRRRFARHGQPGAKVLDDGDVAALFGLEMAEGVEAQAADAELLRSDALGGKDLEFNNREVGSPARKAVRRLRQVEGQGPEKQGFEKRSLEKWRRDI